MARPVHGPSIHDRQDLRAGFPLVTSAILSNTQRAVLDHLGIDRLQLVIGGSIGGMQALQWAMDFPTRSPTASASLRRRSGRWALAPQCHLQRQVIRLDAKWKNGDYGDDPPVAGLALGAQDCHVLLQVGGVVQHPLRPQPQPQRRKSLGRTECSFRCERLSRPSGRKIRPALRYELLSSITRTMDTFDPIRKYGIRAYERIQARVTLVVSPRIGFFPPPRCVPWRVS